MNTVEANREAIERSSNTVLPYKKGKLMGSWDRRMENSKAENCGPYLGRDGVKMTIDEMARSASASAQKSSAASFTSRLMKILNKALYTCLRYLCPNFLRYMVG